MRMPSFSRSYDDWADYLLESELTIDDAIEKTSSSVVASWLDDERGMIEAVMDTKGTAVATFMTKGEILVDSPEEESEDDEVLDEGPAKGIRV